ncbi:MAG: hypothetical protein ACP5QA_11000 [Phycisphaerae bacterium]
MSPVSRKLFLYMGSLVLAMALFLALKGSFFSSSGNGTGQKIKPLAIVQGTGATHISIENRNAQGALQYVMRANLAKPVGGGEYQLIKPELQFYTAKGQSILVDSQTGDVLIGATGGGTAGAGQFDSFGNPYLRKGTLTGHVTITAGPLNSFKPGVIVRQPGQIQMTLGKPLHFDYQQGLLTSRGTVAVRGDQLKFDGSDLTVEINTANKTLEDLQITHGRTLIISGLFNHSATTSTAKSSQTTPATKPATAIAAGAKSGTAAKTITPVLTTYALSFGRHVNVALGDQTMLANTLRLYFQTAEKATAAAGTNAATTSPPAEAGPAPTAPATHTPPAATNKTANPPLVIHWTGPLVLRPTRHSPVVLAGSRDVFLQATGTPGKPVVMRDGPARTGYAPKVTYDSAQQNVTMLAKANQPVRLVDTSMGSITCESLVYNNLTHHAKLTGPGAFAMTGAGGGKNPWRGSWLKELTVQLAPGSRTPPAAATAPAIGQGKLAVKDITLTGGAKLADSQTSLHAEKFAAGFVQTSGKHSGSALRQFVADGNVTIASANPGLPASDINSMRCANLILLTRRPQTQGNPVPDELKAHGRVAITFYQKAAKAGGIPEKFTISAGMLHAHLISRTGSRTAAATFLTGNPGGQLTVGRFRIWNNTVVHIYHIGRPIKATAYELSGDRTQGTVTLQSDHWGKIPSAIYQGADWLRGRTIKLQRALQQVTVPGAGELSLPESSKAAEPRVDVTWQRQMQYSAKTRQATLAGHIVAALVGRPEQHSSLTAPAMLIHFEHRTTDRNAMKLAQLVAFAPAGGNTVVARDASYSKTGALLTGMRLNCRKLAYNAIESLLKIPTAGEMVLLDYRPATTTDTAQQRGQSAFSWSQSLAYHGKTGVVTLRGKVHLRFRPTKPLPVPKTGPGSSPKNPNSGIVLLDADEVLANLNHTASPVKNGVDLGMGGPTRLQSVTATNAALEVNGMNLDAGMLKFDATNDIAQAYGLNGQNAIFSDISGTLHGQARHIIWNLSKARGGVTLIQPTGTATLP